MTIAAALRSSWHGWHLSTKLDGCWAQREFNGSILTGERMRSGMFFAFDIPVAHGEDIRRRQWRDRREALLELAQSFPSGMAIAPEGSGPEFVEAVLRDGGEGVVGKSWDSFFGVGWHKAKTSETFDVRVVEKHSTRMSVRVEFDGQDAGWVAVLFSKFDCVEVGDIIEIAAQCRTASGKFRSPRFLRVRKDKQGNP